MMINPQTTTRLPCKNGKRPVFSYEKSISSVAPVRSRGKSRSMAAFALLLVCLLTTLFLSKDVSAFSTSILRKSRKTHNAIRCPSTITTQRLNDRTLTICRLVTEAEVLAAVDEAERLWAQALEARKTANALSDRAEEEAEAAASTTKEVDDMFQFSKSNKIPITMQQLAQADAAAKSNLDAGSMVNRALKASEEADRLEKMAEEALQRSEEKLEQHLQDFPDSSLAQ